MYRQQCFIGDDVRTIFIVRDDGLEQAAQFKPRVTGINAIFVNIQWTLAPIAVRSA
jgi:hypothetical protein